MHVATAQTAGRGRLGRRWESAQGEGLYLSVVLAPRRPLDAAGLTMAAGLAVLDGVRRLGLARAFLDWPNDVVVGEAGEPARAAKLAGVLVETRQGRASPPTYVLGVGLNVAQRHFSSALEGQRAVTSLAREGIQTSLRLAEEAVLAELPRWLRALEEPRSDLAAAFLAATGLRGRRVCLDVAGARVEGILAELDLARGLCLVSSERTRWVALAHVRQLAPAL